MTADSEKVYVVFSYGDPMPFAACATRELAEAYADAIGQLPKSHPLHTADALVDELPLNRELPVPLRDPEAEVWSAGVPDEQGGEGDV